MAMKRRPPHRIAAILALGCALVPGTAARVGWLQDEPSATAILLSRARTLEQRGRLDLAKQDWSQVLLADPNDAEALAGLVRAARAEGRSGDADKYLARLRAAHPNDPTLAQLQACWMKRLGWRVEAIRGQRWCCIEGCTATRRRWARRRWRITGPRRRPRMVVRMPLQGCVLWPIAFRPMLVIVWRWDAFY